MTPLAAALHLAASGYPVFPCAASTKCPTTPHGFKDASIDSAVIEQLWRDHPGDLVGVPTGKISGFDVLDIDAKHQEARNWWRQNNLHYWLQTRAHRTRSGGFHLLFQHSDVMRCSAGRIMRGVDTRADGGYIIWWPASGLPYFQTHHWHCGRIGCWQSFDQSRDRPTQPPMLPPSKTTLGCGA